MTDENDGMDEVLEATLRVALVAAGRLAEVAARSREQAAQEAQRASQAEGRRLQARMDAERSAARAQLARVERLDWWDRARPHDIAAAWQAALTWRDIDPAAAQATEVLRERIKARYGVDVDGLGGAGTTEALTHADEARKASPRRGGAEQAEAVEVLSRDDRVRAAEAGARAWDSPARRSDLSERVQSLAGAEAAAARTVADTHQGLPAGAAATPVAPRAPREGSVSVREAGVSIER